MLAPGFTKIRTLEARISMNIQWICEILVSESDLRSQGQCYGIVVPVHLMFILLSFLFKLRATVLGHSV